jgi:hypothetical protein
MPRYVSCWSADGRGVIRREWPLGRFQIQGAKGIAYSVWGTREIKLLRKLSAAKWAIKNIAHRLGRGYGSVQGKLWRLGLFTRRGSGAKPSDPR